MLGLESPSPFFLAPIGVLGIVFFVIAAAAPLVGMTGAVPVAIVLGNGSNEVIDIAVRTFLRPGEEVVSAAGAFVVYALATQAGGGTNIFLWSTLAQAMAALWLLTGMARLPSSRERRTRVWSRLLNGAFCSGDGGMLCPMRRSRD